EGRRWLTAALDRLLGRDDFATLSMRDLINELVAAGHPIRVIYVHGHWMDVNSLRDLEHAGQFTLGQR
ncbi:MAG: phosphoenolpyruvate mutase, partial [Gammaproteobacteria bacterium]|nr:phosphoenolpyruvate mutase [Gammaproteobacteria bacterium]